MLSDKVSAQVGCNDSTEPLEGSIVWLLSPFPFLAAVSAGED